MKFPTLFLIISIQNNLISTKSLVFLLVMLVDIIFLLLILIMYSWQQGVRQKMNYLLQENLSKKIIKKLNWKSYDSSEKGIPETSGKQFSIWRNVRKLCSL